MSTKEDALDELLYYLHKNDTFPVCTQLHLYLEFNRIYTAAVNKGCTSIFPSLSTAGAWATLHATSNKAMYFWSIGFDTSYTIGLNIRASTDYDAITLGQYFSERCTSKNFGALKYDKEVDLFPKVPQLT